MQPCEHAFQTQASTGLEGGSRTWSYLVAAVRSHGVPSATIPAAACPRGELGAEPRRGGAAVRVHSITFCLWAAAGSVDQEGGRHVTEIPYSQSIIEMLYASAWRFLRAFGSCSRREGLGGHDTSGSRASDAAAHRTAPRLTTRASLYAAVCCGAACRPQWDLPTQRTPHVTCCRHPPCHSCTKAPSRRPVSVKERATSAAKAAQVSFVTGASTFTPRSMSTRAREQSACDASLRPGWQSCGVTCGGTICI